MQQLLLEVTTVEARSTMQPVTKQNHEIAGSLKKVRTYGNSNL